MKIDVAFFPLALLLFPAELVQAQVMQGRVVEARSREPVPFAVVTAHEGAVSVGRTIADSNGSFAVTLKRLSGGLVFTTRRIGFKADRRNVLSDSTGQVDALVIALERLPIRLDNLEITAPRSSRRMENFGFYDRARAGFGHFITEEDINARQPSRTSDLFRMVPGVRTVPAVRGQHVIVSRAQGRLSRPRLCLPKVLVDGLVVAKPGGPGINFDDHLKPGDIAGIEIYRGPAEMPAEFGGPESDCGVFVIWTK